MYFLEVCRTHRYTFFDVRRRIYISLEIIIHPVDLLEPRDEHIVQLECIIDCLAPNVK